MKLNRKKNRVIRASRASKLGLNVQYNVVDNDSWDVIDSFKSEEDAIRCANAYHKKYPDTNIIVEREEFESAKMRSDADDTVVVYTLDAIQQSTRIRKRSIKAGYQSFGNSGNPFADIEAMKDSFIKQWWRDYDGDPETGWDNIFENALADFEAYANDEASGFLMKQYENGEIGDGDMRNEFDQFTMWKDMNEYDY